MTMQDFVDVPVPEDDFYVTNKMREFAREILSDFDGEPGDSPLVGLLAESIFNLETEVVKLRKRVADLEQRITDAGVKLRPPSDDL
jgi:hypothetical protein